MRLVTPATAADLAEALAAAGHFSGTYWDLARGQLARGPSWALRDGEGTAIVVAGLVPFDDDRAEAWFLPAPSARQHLRRVVRAVRLTLAAAPYREIRVAPVTDEGARIARLAGFGRDDGEGLVWGERGDGVPLWRRKQRSLAATGTVAERSEGGAAPPARVALPPTG